MSIVQQSISSLLDAWIASERKGEQFPVPFDIAWGIAGYSTKASAKRSVLRILKKGNQFSTHQLKTPGGGRSSELMNLSIDGFKHFCLMAETEEGEAIRQYFIEAEKNLRQLKSDREYPKQITGEIAANPTAELIGRIHTVFDLFFPTLAPELLLGMKIEAACSADPTLRPMLEPHKPKLLLDAPLLSPKAIGEILEERSGIKHSSQKVNKLLIEKGLQVSVPEKSPAYKAIGQGIEFSKVVADTAAGHGKTIQSLRWYESVCNLLTD
jgi:hypothetical protein